MKKYFKNVAIFIGLILLFAIPFVGQATMEKADENVYLAPDVVHEGNYYAAGNIVEIAGTVNGDIFVAGNSVTVSGAVNGDIFAAGNSVSITGDIDGSVFSAASNIIISGEVLGNVRVAGSNVTIESEIGRNVMAAGSNIILTSNAEVIKHLNLAGAVLDVRSNVGGNFEAAGESMKISGEIGGNTDLYFDKTGKVVFLPPAHLMGDFKYTASEELIISDDVTIDGEVVYNQFVPKVNKKQFLGLFTVGYFLFKLIQLFGLLVIGLVIVSLTKKKVKETADLMIKNPLAQIGMGIVWFIITPIIVVLLLVTVIGMPLAFLLSLIYIIFICLSKVFAGIAIGVMLTKAFGWDKATLIGSMVLGIIALTLLKSIPVIGWLVGLVTMWWGIGGLVEIKKRTLKEMK
ncbi:polymer-forming cytoskeletal protein [bacterium]|nr:polymer-forming cytoskeletal protein [bacterium]